MDETTLSPAEARALAELEEEFQKELDRNALALQLLKERAEEAKAAKYRAELSQQKMECMKVKYSQVHDKLKTTKQTLVSAQAQIDRQQLLQDKVQNLREMAQEYSEKFQEKRGKGQTGQNLLLIDCPDFDFPQPLINYEEEEEDERRKLQAVEDEMKQDQDPKPTASAQPVPVQPVPLQPSNKIDYARTVTELQEKLSRKSSKGSKSDHEQGEQQEDALAIFTETVQRTEARCAGIHEELGRMALSEQYMRTKQAQLRAKKKAYEAKEALERAEAREKEAVEMRRKVGDMMKLLSERKGKLKVTENTIVKKGKVVDNVNKILSGKARKETYVKNQKVHQIVFGPDEGASGSTEDKQKPE